MTYRIVPRLAALAAAVTAALLLVQSPAATAQESHLQFSMNLGHPGYYLPPPPRPVVVYPHPYYEPPIAYGYPAYGGFGYVEGGHGGEHYHGSDFCRADHGQRGEQKIEYRREDRGHGRDD